MITEKEVTYTLGRDDLPTCPKHGIRIVTDFFYADKEKGIPDHEIGVCPICKIFYCFDLEDEQ